MKMYEEVTVWTCGNSHCQEEHLTREEAEACSPVEPCGTLFRCVACKSTYPVSVQADECCNVEKIEKDLAGYEKELESLIGVCLTAEDRGHIRLLEILKKISSGRLIAARKWRSEQEG